MGISSRMYYTRKLIGVFLLAAKSGSIHVGCWSRSSHPRFRTPRIAPRCSPSSVPRSPWASSWPLPSADSSPIRMAVCHGGWADRRSSGGAGHMRCLVPLRRSCEFSTIRWTWEKESQYVVTVSGVVSIVIAVFTLVEVSDASIPLASATAVTDL